MLYDSRTEAVAGTKKEGTKMSEYHGKVVHTKGSIGRRGVAQGIICRTCPGGCKTDCLRAGVNVEMTRIGSYDFANSFANIEAGDEDIEY